MADTKISDLTPLTNPLLTDEMPIVDTSGVLETKKITYQAFFEGRGLYIVDDPITASTITDARQNATNIQTAIDNANAAGGGTVVLGPGTYEVADPATLGYAIEMKSNIRMIGNGPGTTIKVYIGETGNPFSIIENNPIGITNVSISTLTFDGTKARLPDTVWGWTENEGIDFNTASNVWISNCRIIDCVSDAIDLDNNINAIITDCYMSGNGGPAIHGGLGQLLINNIVSEDNGVYRYQGTDESVRRASACLSWTGLDYSIITNINSKNDGAGVVLKDCSRTVVANCTVEDPGDGVSHPTWPDSYAGNGNAFRFEGCSDSIVIGCAARSRNTVSAKWQECYYMENSANPNRRCSFIGCTNNNARYAYRLENTEYCQVIGCTTNATAYANISLENSGDGNSVKSNTTNGGQIGVFLSASSNNVAADNTINNVTDSGLRLNGPSADNALYNNKVSNSNRGLRMVTSGGTPSGTLILANDLVGNTTVMELLGTGHRIKENNGWNPQGISSITVGASPFTHTAGFYAQSVYIDGGTVSDISKGGTTIATSTGRTVELEPGESLTVTYSVIPTMVSDDH